MIGAAILLAPFIFGQDASLPAPFGVRMGTKKAELGKITKEIAKFKFELATVPKPHRQFESYVVQVTPKAGVCFVKAISVDISTSAYGSELRARFNEIREQVDGVYGKGTLLDYLPSDSIWNEPRDWMMGLLKKERALMTRWSGKDDLIMKYGIRDIFLAAGATSSDTGYVTLEYYFDNYDACEAEVKDSEKNVF
jgi:hypothetical protein